MNETVTFFYADILGNHGEVIRRSPTFSTAQECIEAIGTQTKATVFRITSYCYSWERSDCFRKEVFANLTSQTRSSGTQPPQHETPGVLSPPSHQTAG